MGVRKRFLSVPLSTEPVEQFAQIGQAYVQAWKEFGVDVVLSKSQDFEIFRQASAKIQFYAINYLSFNVDVLHDMAAHGENPIQTKKYLWRVLSRLRFIPPSDFMEFIEDEDVVEMYLVDEIQIFRNHKFMQICSYSVEAILCLPWYRLSRRDWKYLLPMFRRVLKFRLGFIKNIVPWDVAEHLIFEALSEEKLVYSTQLKYFIPLSEGGRPAAVISTNRSRLVPRS